MVSVTPANNSTTAPITTTVSLVFSRPVDRASVTTSAVTLAGPIGLVSGAVTLALLFWQRLL